MHFTRWVLLVTIIFILTACAPGSPSPTVPVTPPADASPTTAPVSAPAQPVFKTAVGDLSFVSARFVSQANSTTPEPGCKLLLVILERTDSAPIDLQQFVDAHMQIFIEDYDGTSTLSTMGGFVDGQFAIGFQVPETQVDFRLVWGENTVVDITPTNS